MVYLFLELTKGKHQKKGCWIAVHNTLIEVLRMTKVLPIEGEYTREGVNFLRKDGSRLIITSRKQPQSPNKGLNFLLYVDSEGNKHYVSSLWSSSVTGKFSLEYKKLRYTLDLTEGTTAKLYRINQKAA